MKKTFPIAAAMFLLAVASAHGQQPAPAAAPAAAKAHFDIYSTPINDIMKDPKAKAIVEAQVPEISQYLGMIGGNTLAQVAAMGGSLDAAKLKVIQAGFDAM